MAAPGDDPRNVEGPLAAQRRETQILKEEMASLLRQLRQVSSERHRLHHELALQQQIIDRLRQRHRELIQRCMDNALASIPDDPQESTGSS